MISGRFVFTGRDGSEVNPASQRRGRRKIGVTHQKEVRQAGALLPLLPGGKGWGEISPKQISRWDPLKRDWRAGSPASSSPSKLIRADLEVGAPVRDEARFQIVEAFHDPWMADKTLIQGDQSFVRSSSLAVSRSKRNRGLSMNRSASLPPRPVGCNRGFVPGRRPALRFTGREFAADNSAAAAGSD
jgi:hypothetical protein